ncbi:MAG: hypothetical protein LBU04_08315 [Christensenellaceae bacterium]|jgi:hypothetical protein|nr:hypothetical protein [Christensenellaceae bacterium]
MESLHERVPGRCNIQIGSPIQAYAITGPIYFSKVSGEKIFHSYGTQKMTYSGSGASHEIHHHLVKCIDADLMLEGVVPLIMELRKRYCDESYISSLERIWTNMKEFRNITSVFIREGIIYYDGFTEGALLLSKGKKIRSSHSDAIIRHVPIQLVRLMTAKQKLVDNVEEEQLFTSWIK